LRHLLALGVLAALAVSYIAYAELALLAPGGGINKAHHDYLVLKATLLGLTGVPVDGLSVAVCTEQGLIHLAYAIVPPEAWSPESGPLYQPTLSPSSYIVVKLPSPASRTPIPARINCGWTQWESMMRYHNIILAEVSGYPYPVVIYYDKRPLLPTTPSSQLFRKLAQKAGAIRGNSIDIGALGAFVERLMASHHVKIVAKKTVKGWIINTKNSEVTPTAVRPQPQPNIVYIDGGSSTITYMYSMSTTIVKDEVFERNDGVYQEFYIGNKAVSASITALVESIGGKACLTLGATVRKVNPVTGSADTVYGSRAVTTCINGIGELTLPIEVSIDSNTYQKLATYLKVTQGKIHIKLLTVNIVKYVSSPNPPQERQGLQILSAGIPGGISSKYVMPPTGSGLAYPTLANTEKTIDYAVLNGLFIDLTDTWRSGYLQLQLRVENHNPAQRTGKIEIYVGNRRVASWTLTLPAHSEKTLLTKIPARTLADTLRYNTGGLITIRNTFNDARIWIRVDAVLLYSYIPEIWDIDNRDLGCTWYREPSPAAKGLVNLYGDNNPIAKMSYVVEQPFLTNYGSLTAVMEASLTFSEARSTGIKEGYLEFCIPEYMKYSRVMYNIRVFDKTRSSEAEFVGAVETAFKILSTAYELATLVIPGTKAIDAALVVIGVIENFIPEPGAGMAVTKTVTINGADYTCYVFDAKRLADADAVQIAVSWQHVLDPKAAGPAGSVETLYVRLGLGEAAYPQLYITNYIPVKVLVAPSCSGLSEYTSFVYGRDDVEYG